MAIIIPKLGLEEIRDAELSEFALDKVEKINDHAADFPGLVPDTAAVQTKTIEWNAALVAADEGTKADTALKDQRRIELEDLLKLQAQNCAEIAAGDLPKYLRSGYEAKDTSGTSVGPLPRPDMKKVEPTSTVGELAAEWTVVKKRQNYTVRAYTNDNDPQGSQVYMEVVGPSRHTLTGLPSGAKVYVDVRANGGSTGHSPWSDSDWARPR